jgi:ATP-dependent Clp protease ATP-binding subunit ClpA
VTLEVDDEVKDLLAREGYDPVFGARPLKRVIQSRIQNPLALRLLEEEVEEGTRIRVLAPEPATDSALHRAAEEALRPESAGTPGPLRFEVETA